MGRQTNQLNAFVCNHERTLFQGGCDALLVPTKRGEVALMPYHEPIILLLAKGKIQLVQGGERSELCACEKGVARIDDNKAVIMVDL